MTFDRPLDHVLGARPKVALLRLLLRTRGEHTGRSLAKRVDFDSKTCHAALRDLARQGVVEHRRAGSSILYRVNERHVLVRELLEPLFDREGTFLSGYARELRSRLRAPLVSLVLFGSVARGEERPTSDVDLIVIVPDASAVPKAEEGVDQAAADLAGRYGNPPQVIVLDRETFGRKARTGDPLISEVLRTGRVLVGKSIAKVLKSVS